jgi:hypothetical protein
MKSFKVLYNPKKVFNEIAQNTNWGTDYIILSFILVIIAIFILPIKEQILNNFLALKGLSANQMELIKSTAKKTQYIDLIAEPIIFLIKTLVLTILLYLGILLYKGKKIFKELFSLSIAAFIIMVLSSLANMVLLYFKGVENINGVIDTYAIGLNIYFNYKVVGIPLYQFLTHVNIFEVWFVIILIFGVNKIAEIGKIESSIIVISTWLIFIIFDVVQAIQLYKTLQIDTFL